MVVYGVSYVSPRKEFWLLPHTLTLHKYAAIEYIQPLGGELGLNSPTEAEMSGFPFVQCFSTPIYTLCTYISGFFLHAMTRITIIAHSCASMTPQISLLLLF